MPEHPHGWLSLLPPLIAILLAITTQRIFSSLLAGILAGALILSSGNPITALAAVGEQHLWPSLADPDHLRVFTFTAIMGALVGVMRQAGGFEAIVGGLGPVARSRRGGQLTVWMLGLIVFFDDYANSLLLGNTMRPLTDRLRISREKLAYLVDSTAAPVSGLALVSTWVAGEIGFIRDGLATVELADQVDGFQIFVATIPYRFYVLWALLFVPIVALIGRDFGPMWHAERAAQDTHLRSTTSKELARPSTGKWWDAVLPIIAVVGVTIVLILATGAVAVAEDSTIEQSWLNLFGNGDSYLALVYGALAGLGTAILLACVRRFLSLDEARDAALGGARQVLPALVILWLAWSLSRLTDDEHLGTGTYLATVLQHSLDVRWMPTAVFLLASVVAFATGTSWGTMGILMPLVISVTVQMISSNGATVASHDPLLLATIGGVLAGAIFGDHCSPISDTTVLSSQASGCEHMAHVRTQMPYALLVAAISIVCGTIPVGFGASAWLLLPIGIAAMALLLFIFGRPVRDSL
jgi:Na+/H+ antiporter NhaC